MQENLPGTTDTSIVNPDAPIRFPHIPSRRNPPPGTAHWIRKEDFAVRVDATHEETVSKRVPEIPGIRTDASGKIKAEAFDDRLLPEPVTQDDSTVRREKSDLLVMTEQMRLRLVDFGNILARSDQPDQRLDRAFETVCRCYSQLAAIANKS